MKQKEINKKYKLLPFNSKILIQVESIKHTLGTLLRLGFASALLLKGFSFHAIGMLTYSNACGILAITLIIMDIIKTNKHVKDNNKYIIEESNKNE
jgi:hypothetical protein